MNRLTAYRTFGKASYTPAKRVKVYNNRYYLVTFQNVESDPRTDYHGLADGEYIKLLDGRQTRAARDAHLNHCNAISEYSGPVYEYAQQYRQPEYFTSEVELGLRVHQLHIDHDADMARIEKEALRHEAMTPELVIANAKRSGIGIARISEPSWITEQVEWHQRIAAETRQAMHRLQPASFTARRIS